MDLVAIYHRVIVLVSRHERDKSLDLIIPLDEEVLEVEELHLFLLRSWFPAIFGFLIVCGTCCGDKIETSFKVWI